MTYEWDFDYDGVNFDVDATGPTVAHTYTAAGVYTVALRATDDLSMREVSALDIAVPECIPTVSEWGLVVMALLVLAAGAITINRRRRLTYVDNSG